MSFIKYLSFFFAFVYFGRIPQTSKSSSLNILHKTWIMSYILQLGTVLHYYYKFRCLCPLWNPSVVDQSPSSPAPLPPPLCETFFIRSLLQSWANEFDFYLKISYSVHLYYGCKEFKLIHKTCVVLITVLTTITGDVTQGHSTIFDTNKRTL